MKTYLHKKSAIIIFAVLLLVSALPFAAGADESIYVNDASSVLSGKLDSAYAIGSGGAVSKLSNTYAYVMTGSGLTTVGSSPIVIPSHLSVTGTVAVGYPKVRVGLYYWDDSSSVRNPTLESANLENAVGSGYKFGYYDSARVFHEVGYTAETQLTMCIDKNVDTAGGHIGCFHVRLNTAYADYGQASAAAQQYSGGFPAYYNGTYYVLVGNYDSSAEASTAASALGLGGSAYSGSDKCVVVSRTSDAKILFEFDCGSSANLAVSPQSASGKAVTWFKGYKYYGDFEYLRRAGGNMTVINTLDIEDYVKGVITSEMNASWPLEALKAQALCARTYAAAHFNAYSYYGFDVTNDTYSQAYRGVSLATARSDSAVDATAGQYITYGGKLITAMYYSSNGGGSEDSENVYSAAYPYLRGVIDPFEEAVAGINSKSSWTYTISKANIYAALRSYGASSVLSNVSSVDVTPSDTGNAIRIAFTDTGGRTTSLSCGSCYNFSTGYLGLPSIHYTVYDAGSSVVFTGGGWGHSVGMSQYGAYAMASAYGYTYDQIVSFYYTGVSLSAGSRG